MKMGVRIIEPRHHSASTKIDPTCAGARETPNLGIRTSGTDTTTCNREGFDKWPASRTGKYFAVDQDKVGRLTVNSCYADDEKGKTIANFYHHWLFYVRKEGLCHPCPSSLFVPSGSADRRMRETRHETA